MSYDHRTSDQERIDDWCRYIKALHYQDSKIQALAHLDTGMRREVLKKLGMKTAEDVFNGTAKADAAGKVREPQEIRSAANSLL